MAVLIILPTRSAELDGAMPDAPALPGLELDEEPMSMSANASSMMDGLLAAVAAAATAVVA